VTGWSLLVLPRAVSGLSPWMWLPCASKAVLTLGREACHVSSVRAGSERARRSAEHWNLTASEGRDLSSCPVGGAGIHHPALWVSLASKEGLGVVLIPWGWDGSCSALLPRCCGTPPCPLAGFVLLNGTSEILLVLSSARDGVREHLWVSLVPQAMPR